MELSLFWGDSASLLFTSGEFESFSLDAACITSFCGWIVGLSEGEGESWLKDWFCCSDCSGEAGWFSFSREGWLCVVFVSSWGNKPSTCVVISFCTESTAFSFVDCCTWFEVSISAWVLLDSWIFGDKRPSASGEVVLWSNDGPFSASKGWFPVSSTFSPSINYLYVSFHKWNTFQLSWFLYSTTIIKSF